MGRRRLGVILFAGGVAAMGGIGVAGATLQQSGLKCSGSAIVTAPDGSIATIRAEDKEVDLPAEGVARWRGSTSPVSHDHRGAVYLDLGLADVELGTWGGPNRENKPGTAGVEEYEIPGWVPPFAIDVFGFHDAKEGSCSGRVRINIEGNALGDPVALGALGITLLMSGALISSGWAGGGIE